ncbi:sentrin-specific protease 6 isoform X2 [Antennarius striatus]|uniref:sentrin-specific protease 6 isoform X2 n=1 Tax=Antennarius striatus TaxID=241820 RepID=UPI0035AFC048
MAHNRSLFLEALGRTETRRDGGFKQSWSSAHSDGDGEERTHDAAVSVEEMDRQQPPSPEEKAPPLRHFTSSDPLRTYEHRPLSHARPPGRLGPKRLSEVPVAVATSSSIANRTNFLLQGIVLQGRHFQHAQVAPPSRKPVHRNDFPPTQRAVEVDSIILTCPEAPEEDHLNVRRRLQQKRRPLEDWTAPPQEDTSEPGGGRCQSCGSGPAQLPSQQATLSSPTPRAPLRSQPPPGLNDAQQNFYKPGTTATRAGFRGGASRTPPPLIDGRPPPPTGTSGCCVTRTPAKARKGPGAPEFNDPIVLSSDDEEEADSASTGSASRLDSVSPRPADSAHSSPAPSGGRVEAAVKSGEQDDHEFFNDVNMKISIPRRGRMKDQFGNQPPPEPFSPRPKKPKVAPSRCASIILQCRSLRVGTLRRTVMKPVVFSIDNIQLEIEGAEQHSVERVCLRASALVRCEWCNVRKLPVLFFQTTPDECERLREQLHMTREDGGHWYDCSGAEPDERYIVLILENGLVMKEQVILEDILGEIGRSNQLSDFPSKLLFDEANIRLVNFNNAALQKEDKVKPTPTPPRVTHFSPVTKVMQVSPINPGATPTRTRMVTRQQTSGYYDDEDDEDMTDLQPTFTGPIIKLMVYPPPPAKGGISVTNEDLHCLHDGEFLNDVIIDFYLKYLVLEKLKKEDAQRIHVFSSFFYKRLNQRERRNVPDTTNLPIQKRKHNRVKTWTRHVDLFQKDFIFVPINESAHWYLAVICFPGLKGTVYEQNLLFHTSPPEVPLDEGILDHCRPLSPDREGPDSSSEDPERPAEGPADGDATKEYASFSEGGADASGSAPDQRCSSALHRISVCYGSEKGDDDGHAFSDDQSSCQDDCSDEESPAADTPDTDAAALTSKQIICKQPCILIMDSLRGPTRSTVVKTLREYLEVEWEVRRGSARSFGKEVMKGSSPRVPQQDNFSDCGVYVLQYVESFFETPIQSFQLPLNLSDWFLQQRMKTKRQEIRELILKLQDQQQLDRKPPPEAPPTASEEADIQETSGSTDPPPPPPVGP